MMQPPRHIRATPPLLISQPYSSAVARHQGEALGVGDDLAGVERQLDVVDERLAVAVERWASGRAGPCDAATRSSFWAERQRAKTASAISGSGTPRSSARTVTVHLPGALLAGGVEDQVDQRLAGLRVVVAEDVAR